MKVKSMVAICMVLLLGLGLGFYFGSIGVVPSFAYTPPSGKTVEYPFYCTGNVSGGPHEFWGGYVNAPAPDHPDYDAAYQPPGFTFSFSIPYFKADNITETPPPPPPYPQGPTGILYKDNCTGNSNGIIKVNITNNLGCDITIIDLTAEVTDSPMTLAYIHKFAGYKTFAGMSMLGVDPIDPYTDDLLLGYLAAPPRVSSNDLDEHYKNWTGATGPEPGKYSDVYGPTSLRQKSDYPPTDDLTKPKADNVTNILPPEILADGATYTEYFGAFWGGNMTQGTNLYGTITLKLTYTAPTPVASFTYLPTWPVVNQTVTFDASASTPDGGTIMNYTWDFGDDNVTTVTNPIITHTYTTEGTYTVTLNVTDSEGLWDIESKTLRVRMPGAPLAYFTFSPESPIVNQMVTFNASASSADGGTIMNYTWDFGDDNVTTVTSPIITHKYTAFGTYTVNLTITDSEGLSDTKSESIQVIVGVPPVASFTYTPAEPTVDETVTFNASASTPGGGTLTDPDSYVWDFGDGTTDTGKIVTHAYTEKGNYTVVLNVTNSQGLLDTESKSIVVSAAAAFPWVWVVVIVVVIVVVVAAVAVAVALRRRKK